MAAGLLRSFRFREKALPLPASARRLDPGLVEGLEQQAEGNGLRIGDALSGQRLGQSVVQPLDGRAAVLGRGEQHPVARDGAVNLRAKPVRAGPVDFRKAEDLPGEPHLDLTVLLGMREEPLVSLDHAPTGIAA